VTRPKPIESAGHELNESKNGETQTRWERSTPHVANPWKIAENQGVKAGNQGTQSTGRPISWVDGQEKETLSKSPRIGEIEGTTSSRPMDSNSNSKFKTQELKIGSPHGNNSEREFNLSRWEGKDYLLCEGSAPLNPGRRSELQQSKGSNGTTNSIEKSEENRKQTAAPFARGFRNLESGSDSTD
ncbi:hypothetical protein U1Q18_013052, partial [Sarracenia purpurea var. burkii]